MGISLFETPGSVWGRQRAYSYLCVFVSIMTSLAVLLVLITYNQFPPPLIPDSPPGFFLFAMAVVPVAILYVVNQGLVPTFLLSLGPAVAKYYYTHYVYTEVIFDFGIVSSIPEILITSVSYWLIGLVLAVAVRLLGNAFGIHPRLPPRDAT